MKKAKKILITTAVATTLASSITPSAFAQNTSSINNQKNQQTQHTQLNEEYFAENSTYFNQYIQLDDNQQKYYLSIEAKNTLDHQTLKALNKQLKITNQNIKETLANNTNDEQITITNPQFKQTETQSEIGATLAARKYKEGVNKVVFHWWGTSIYISKSNLNRIGAGLTIGGIWLPEPLLSKVIATMGVAVGRVPGGMIFDRVYISPTLFNNVRWQ